MIKTLKNTTSEMYNYLKDKVVRFKNWLVILVLGAAVVAAPLVLPPIIPNEYKLKCDKSRVLFSKDVDWIVEKEDGTFENKGKIKKYLYASNKKIPAIKDEDITKRTKNAQFIKKEKKDGKQEWEGRFYTGEPFYKDDNEWYQTETATTTIDFFDKQMKVSLLNKILGNKILADTTSYYTSSGDGFVFLQSYTSWDTTHDAIAGSRNYASTYTNSHAGRYSSGAGGKYRIGRSFLPINTSGLPDDASISAAILKIYPYSNPDGYNDSQSYIVVVQTDQSSNYSLVTADFNNCGAIDDPTQGSNQVDITGISTGAYNNFTLNATGRGWISKTGWTKLGMREGHDCEDTIPSTYDRNSGVWYRPSEQADTTQDPYLEVTYTAGGAAERRMFLVE